MEENRALSQDIRPIKIVILNLMPDKIVTETSAASCNVKFADSGGYRTSLYGFARVDSYQPRTPYKVLHDI